MIMHVYIFGCAVQYYLGEVEITTTVLPLRSPGLNPLAVQPAPIDQNNLTMTLVQIWNQIDQD